MQTARFHYKSARLTCKAIFGDTRTNSEQCKHITSADGICRAKLYDLCQTRTRTECAQKEKYQTTHRVYSSGCISGCSPSYLVAGEFQIPFVASPSVHCRAAATCRSKFELAVPTRHELPGQTVDSEISLHVRILILPGQELPTYSTLLVCCTSLCKRGAVSGSPSLFARRLRPSGLTHADHA